MSGGFLRSYDAEEQHQAALRLLQLRPHEPSRPRHPRGPGRRSPSRPRHSCVQSSQFSRHSTNHGCRRSFINPRLLRDRHPRPHHKGAAMRTQPVMRWGSNSRPTASSSLTLPTRLRHPYGRCQRSQSAAVPGSAVLDRGRQPAARVAQRRGS